MGFAEAQFWYSTPRQIMTHFDAVRFRVEREHRARMSHAWHVAMLSRVKKIPPLDSLIGIKNVSRKRQDWREQKSIAMALNAAFGGAVIER